MEVSKAAANSEDAGLLQYSKTLDSLETKLNNIKTSFQQFYMSILNGDSFGTILDFINNLIKGLNKLPKLEVALGIGAAIINIKQLAKGLTTGVFGLLSKYTKGASSAKGGTLGGFVASKFGVTAVQQTTEAASTAEQEQQPVPVKIDEKQSPLKIDLEPLRKQTKDAKTNVQQAQENKQKSDEAVRKAQENKKAIEAEVAKEKVELDKDVLKKEQALREKERILEQRQEAAKKAPGNKSKTRKVEDSESQLATVNKNLTEAKEKQKAATERVTKAQEDLAKATSDQAKAAQELDTALIEQREANRELRMGRLQRGLAVGGQIGSVLLPMAGAALTTASTAVADDNLELGRKLSAAGTVASIGGQITSLAASIHPLAGGIAALGTVVVSAAAAIFTGISDVERAQEKYEKAKKASEEADLERAEKQERARTLETSLEQLKKLEKSQYDSVEAQQAFIDAQNTMAASYPELVSAYDDAGNAIIDLQNAEVQLANIRREGSAAALAATEAEIEEQENNLKLIWSKQWEAGKSFGITPKNTGNVETFLTNYSNAFDNLFAKLYLTEDREIGGISRERINEFLEKYSKATLDEITYAFENEYRDILDLIFGNVSGVTPFDAYKQYIETYLPNEQKYEDYITKRNENFQTTGRIRKTLQGLEKIRISDVVDLALDDYAISQNDYNGFASEFASANSVVLSKLTDLVLDEEGKIDLTRWGIEKAYDKAGNLTKEAKNKLAELVIGIAQSLETGYDIILGKGEENEFNEFVSQAQLGKFSFSYIEERLKDFADDNNAIVSGYITEFTGELEAQKESFKNWFTSDRMVDLSPLTSDIESFLNEIPVSLLVNLRAMVNKIEEQIKNGQISSAMGNNFINQYSEILKAISNPELGLTEAEQQEAYQKLNKADLTTVFGIYDFIDSLSEAGFSGLADKVTAAAPELIKNSLINVTAEYDNFLSKIAANADKVRDAMRQASEGVDSIIEARELAKTLGIDFSELKFDSGKFYFRDTGKIKEKLQESLEEELEALYGEGEDSVFSGYIAAARTLGFTSTEEFKRFNFKQQIAQLSSQEGLTEDEAKILENLTKWQSLLDQYREGYLSSLKEGEEATTRGFLAYLESIRSNLDAAGQQLIDEYTEYYTSEIETTNAENEILASLQGTAQQEAWQEAGNLLTKLTGYTAQEVSQIGGAFGISEEDIKKYFTEQDDGSYSTSLDNILEILDGTRTDITNELISVILSDVESLKSSMFSLGEEIGSENRALTDIDLYEVFKPIFGELERWEITLLTRYFQGGNKVGFIEFAATRNISNKDAGAMWDNFFSGVNSGAQTYQKNTLDAYLQFISGELDPTTIEDSSLKNELLAFEGNIEAALDAYIQGVFAQYSGNFDKLVSGISEGYSAQAKRSSRSTTGLAKAITESQGLSQQDAVNALSILSAAKGRTYNFEDFFEYNPIDETWIPNVDRLLTEIQIAATDAGDKAAEAQLREQLAYFEGWQKENQKTKLASTLQDLSTAEEVTAENIQELYEAFGENIDAIQAQRIADVLQDLDPLNRLEELGHFLRSQNIHLDTEKYQSLISQVFDAILSIIENGLSNLVAGAEGTLNYTDYNKLVQRYGLSGTGRMTSTGVQMSEAEQKQLIAALYQEAERGGVTGGFGKQLWDSLKDSQQGLFKGYSDIETELKGLSSEIGVWAVEQGKLTEEGQAYAAALQQARAAAIMDENSYEFSFMDQEVIGGMTKNFDNFLTQIDSVKSAFSSLEANQPIDYSSFLNLFDFLNRFSPQFQKTIQGLGKDYETFITGVITKSEEIGKVDIGAIAGELGIDVKTAMSTMTEDMSEGLKDIAQQQVNYLTGIEKMLEAMQALEDVGTVEAGIEFTVELNGQEKSFESVSQVWDEMAQLSDETSKHTLMVAFETAIEGSDNEGQKALLKVLRGDQEHLTEQELFAYDYFTKNKVDFSALSEQQAQAIAALFSPDQLATLISSAGDSWEQALTSQLDSILDNVKSKLEELLSSQDFTLTLGGQSIKVDASEITSSSFKITGAEALSEGDLKQALNSYLLPQGLALNDKNGLVAGTTAGEYTVNVQAVTDFSQATSEAQSLGTEIKNVPTNTEIAVDMVGNALSGVRELRSSLRALGSSTYTIRAGTTFSEVYTGSMNNITGSAFADGSIGRLISGAQLAQKTLVGELGPELAVYDGQYHLLGQQGAEFVDLPKSAIVFNHLQTAGILSGQMKDARGKPLTPGSAMATGNVRGPAAAGGISSALNSVRRAKSVWEGLLHKLTAAELAGGGGRGGGGGGSGNTLKAVIQELEEWYNLSRQIANLEQEINNIVAERENIVDGGAYLRSLREQQKLLHQQMTTQSTLLEYQKLQLKRQADQINQNRIWSQFLTVDETGLLQYIKGNETNGGKGALQVLQQLNEMSGQEQVDFLKRIGYSYTTNEGEALEGTELVEQFFEELQDQIDQYDSLYDTVHETEQTLEELQHNIEEINEEIRQNQMDLESAIYDIIVKAWEAEIDEMEKQADIIKEANDAYINGLNDALSSEKEAYSRNQDISEREQLQRQLSLLRRSGGSASEIADLEKQLDGMLRDEYFSNQEQVIENIRDANEEQTRALQEQITLQKDALEYQKENGVIWTKVYEVMSGTADEILAFMQGNSTDFFSKSLLQQEQMLTDWAKKIGIYTEDRVYNNYSNFAKTNIWDTGNAWSYGNLNQFRNIFDSLSPEEQNKLKEQYASVYANARMNGSNNEDAATKAAESIYKALQQRKQQQDAERNKPPVVTPPATPPSTPPGGNGGGGGNGKTQYLTITYRTLIVSGPQTGSSGGGSPVGPTSLAVGSSGSFKWNPSIGYEEWGYMNSNSALADVGRGTIKAKAPGTITITLTYKSKGKTNNSKTNYINNKTKQLSYSKGGLVDYTGIAAVHGTKSKPEGFLNAEQTAQIREGLELVGNGKSRILGNLRETIGDLNTTLKSINTSQENYTNFTVAPGAVSIQVAQLNDAYDIEELSNDVMNRMVNIAQKTTKRGVNRR